jgi:hypothetical protein
MKEQKESILWTITEEIAYLMRKGSAELESPLAMEGATHRAVAQECAT